MFFTKKNIFKALTLTFVVCFALATCNARTISSLSFDVPEKKAYVTCSKGEEDTLTALYLAWSNDGIDKGEDISAWENICRVGLIPADNTEYEFSLPSFAEVTAQYAARVFLYETKYGYDYLVEGVKSSGTAATTATSYVDTGVYPTGNKTITVVNCKMNNTIGPTSLI
jgi:hypothetical protein